MVHKSQEDNITITRACELFWPYSNGETEERLVDIIQYTQFVTFYHHRADSNPTTILMSGRPLQRGSLLRTPAGLTHTPGLKCNAYIRCHRKRWKKNGRFLVCVGLENTEITLHALSSKEIPDQEWSVASIFGMVLPSILTVQTGESSKALTRHCGRCIILHRATLVPQNNKKKTLLASGYFIAINIADTRKR